MMGAAMAAPIATPDAQSVAATVPADATLRETDAAYCRVADISGLGQFKRIP
jgi:Tat protein secretion system quality control protein TatD with DNase activity